MMSPMGEAGPRIGILLDHIEGTYHLELVESAVRTAHHRDTRVVILAGGALTESGTPGRARGFLYDYMRSAKLDGLLVLGGTLSNYCGREPFDHWVRTLPKVPTVVVGIESSTAASVHVDNFTGIEAVIDHLVEQHGRRHIAFVAGPPGSYESETRKRAYLAATARHELGLGERYVVAGGLAREQGIDAVVHLLEDKRLTAATLDAIVAVNDDVAIGVIEELTRRKISVPGQVSVAGFDDAPLAALASPPLTTVNQRLYEQGTRAMTKLIDAVTGVRPLEPKTLKAELVVRDSCGCVLTMKNASSKPPEGMLHSARQAITEQAARVADRLTHAAQGRLRGGVGWERRLVDAVILHITSDRPRLVREFEYIARRSGATGLETCHEVLTTLRREILTLVASDHEARWRVEDLMQECRLSLANVALFAEREHQLMQGQHLREITRACLERAHGADLGELAVTLEEQLPLLGIRHFVISRGNEDDLDVVAHGIRRGGQEPPPTVSVHALGMDEPLEDEKTVIVLPLSATGHQVGLAAMNWGEADPYLFEKLRDLLGMALGLA